MPLRGKGDTTEHLLTAKLRTAIVLLMVYADVKMGGLANSVIGWLTDTLFATDRVNLSDRQVSASATNSIGALAMRNAPFSAKKTHVIMAHAPTYLTSLASASLAIPESFVMSLKVLGWTFSS